MGSAEDLSAAFKRLAPGTLAGIDGLCDFKYWSEALALGEIQVENPNALALKFLQVNKQMKTKLEFIAGSGEFEGFNVKFLVATLLDQMQENQRYTKSMEAYVEKLKHKLKQAQDELATTQAKTQPSCSGCEETLHDTPLPQ